MKSLCYGIEYDDVKKSVEGTFVTPHIARYLVKKYPEKFSSVRDVFDKLLSKGKKAFIKTHDRVSIKDAITVIRQASGVSILAHPGVYPREHSIRLIDYFIENHGDGIETYYPYHIIFPELNIDNNGNQKMIDFYKRIARSRKILESGGNDHHDKQRFTFGEVKIPDKVLRTLKNSLQK